MTHGQASICTRFFDINWYPSKVVLQNKVLLPVLGAPYGEVLENQALRLIFEEGLFEVQYYEHRLPVAPDTTTPILQACLPELLQRMGSVHQQTLELESIITVLSHLPPRTDQDAEQVAARYRETADTCQRLAVLHATCAVAIK